MHRPGEHLNLTTGSSSSSGTSNEKLKQKKRLSFREPEVESPHNSSWSNSNRMQPKPSALLMPGVDGPRQSTSLEDLTLEDQTFIIAKNVGQAFDKRPYERRQLNKPTTSDLRCSDVRSIRQNGGFLSETLQNDCSRLGSELQKSGSSSRANLASEDARYFEALSPPILNMSTMKYPTIEVTDSSVAKPNQALLPSTGAVPTSFQHQMQFLKYQLEQQRQQTQAALSHIQLLKDQLQAETSARYKAQTQNHQLIIQNKELLDHIQKLFHQIQDLEKQLEKHERKPTFPSSQEPQKEPQVRETPVTNALVPQKNSSNGKERRTSIFAPAPVLSNRRSSMTNLNLYQPRGSYLEVNRNHDEVQPSSRGSSPAPQSQMGNPPPLESTAGTTNNTKNGRSFLFNSTQRRDDIKDSYKKERHEDTRNGSAKELQRATKTSGNLQVPSIPASNLTLTDATKTNKKSEVNFHDEKLILKENPFFIEEESPRKLGYVSRKNPSTDTSPDSPGVSSVALSPKSYTNRSKSSKYYNNNDSLLPLTLDDNTASSLCMKENKRFSSGTSRLFNS